MTVCPFCDHRNAARQKHCQSCGAELPVSFDTPEPETTSGAATPGLESDIERLLRSEGVIPAIKHYREVTGLGLKESKEAVERIARDRHITPTQAAGCTTAVVALVATLTLAWTCIVAGAGRWPW